MKETVMKYLLDTCVISELVKTKPNKKVVSWITGNDEANFYLCSLTFGELYKGVSKLPDSKRKKKLYLWIEQDLKERFAEKILDIDLAVATTWGEIQGASESAGSPMPAIDGLIAATGLANDLTVVTRNTTDMLQSGVPLLNPWD
jgi:predicted nucleic acid-binding protein